MTRCVYVRLLVSYPAGSTCDPEYRWLADPRRPRAEVDREHQLRCSTNTEADLSFVPK